MTDKDTGSRVPTASFAVAFLAAIGLAVVYWTGGDTRLEGVMFALAFGGIGVGIVTMASAWLPDELVTEDRGQLASDDEERAETRATSEARDEPLVERRRAVQLMVAALSALGAALIFPLRSLGPRPASGLGSTPFRSGGRVVTADGSPVKADAIPLGAELTVFPEGHTLSADAPAVLVRVEDRLLNLSAERREGTIDGLVAYSKICTHAGCPVGLFQAESGLLLCPCHQSTFDVLNGAEPTFGPATRALPQLPITADADGYIVATGDYSEPVGPGFWNRPS